MENFTPYLSLIGGILIGLSAAAMLVLNGRIAGISGIFDGTIMPKDSNFGWKAAFIGGLLSGGLAMFLLRPELFAIDTLTPDRSLAMFIVAGLLVGFGTRLGNGCTSGHGVCGLSRTSGRSLVATLSFMGVGVVTVFLVHHVILA